MCRPEIKYIHATCAEHRLEYDLMGKYKKNSQKLQK